MELLHRNYKIEGKVQGVFYRKSTLNQAQVFGLSGFVRNEPNGSVYIEAEGIKEQLEKFEEWCKIGPERARVSSVTITEGELTGFRDFSIVY